jgi:hypothetical protein
MVRPTKEGSEDGYSPAEAARGRDVTIKCVSPKFESGHFLETAGSQCYPNYARSWRILLMPGGRLVG